MSSKVHAEVIPERPSGRIGDTLWSLLEGCWNKDPAKRPTTVELYNALSDPSSRHRVTETPRGRVIVGLAPELRLRFESIAPSPTANPLKRRQFYVKLKYGEMNHTTPSTAAREKTHGKVWYAYARFCPLSCR